MSEKLKPCPFCIEWYGSGDYGLDNLKKHLEDYRKEK